MRLVCEVINLNLICGITIQCLKMITEYEISIQQDNLFTDLFFFPPGKSYITHR